MKKISKKTVSFLIVILLIIFILFFYNLSTYTAESDIEAVNDIWASDLENCETIIYKYETKNKELILYKSKSGTTYECILNKKNIFGETKYKNDICYTSGFVTKLGDWNVVNRNFKYAIVNNENDIEKFDYGDDEFQCTKIDFTFSNGNHRSRYVYVIDKTY